eukprot:6408058-Pyramimonas_sp.AAC.1
MTKAKDRAKAKRKSMPCKGTPPTRRPAPPPSLAPSASHARTAPKDAVFAWESGSKSSARGGSWPDRPRTSLALAKGRRPATSLEIARVSPVSCASAGT